MIVTLALSSALAACTISDPILDHTVGTGGNTGVGGAQVWETGVGGRGVGGAHEFGVGGMGVGGAQVQEPGVGGRGVGGAHEFGVGGMGVGGTPDFGVGGAMGVGGRQSGTGGNGVGGAPGGDCDQQLTLFDCNARPDCHAVFFDPGNCACASLGCCAQFHHCAGGFTAICTGLITCAVLPPHCESPYLISYRDGCYEGCVHYRDCPP